MLDPDLTSYTGSLTTGTPYKIQRKGIIWVTVGHGGVQALGPTSLTFGGLLDGIGQLGQVGVMLTVIGESAGTIDLDITDLSSSLAANGPCSFSESGSNLTVSFMASVDGGSPQQMSMVLEPDDDGVEIAIGGKELRIGS
jgi:hypothetical protein